MSPGGGVCGALLPDTDHSEASKFFELFYFRAFSRSIMAAIAGDSFTDPVDRRTSSASVLVAFGPFPSCRPFSSSRSFPSFCYSSQVTASFMWLKSLLTLLIIYLF